MTVESKSFTGAHHAQGLRSARIMESQGGFCQALAMAYYRADLSNAKKLFFAFEPLFTQASFAAAEV